MEQIYNFLNKILEDTGHKLSTDEIIYYCPFCHHHKRKLQINVESQNWRCWVCNVKGQKLIQLVKKLHLPKVHENELKSLLPKSTGIFKSDVNKKDIEIQEISLPIEFKPLYKKYSSIEYKHAMIYLENRNINLHDILRYNLGFCETGEYKNRIIIPSYDENNNLNYFVSRTFMDDYKKYMMPKISKDLIMFENQINWNEPIVLVEGVFDAIAIKNNAIPLLGKTMSKKLLKKIIDKKVKKIYVALDNDAMIDAIKISEYFFNNGISVYIMLLDDKDPSILGYKKSTELKNTSVQLNQNSLLKFKMKNK